MAGAPNSILLQALKHNWEVDRVSAQLIAEGHDEVSVDLLLREFKKLRHAKRQQIGFVLIAVGAFLGLLSCLLSIFNPIPALFNLILYGLTSVAIIIAFTGLYFILE